MLRSLSSSVSGMKNHQTLLDVISNNIANVNTVGFKASRVTFENAMNQTLKGAVRPDETGGTNAIQIGMGLGLGSIDTLMNQGNLQTTGNVTDLAIEGESFFAIANGDQVYYTRDGAFQVDASGSIVHSTNGFILQGKMADQAGEIESGTTIGNIVIPYSAQSPAKASSEIEITQNLDSDSEALGTVVNSQSYFAVATDGSGNGVRNTDDSLVNLYNSSGEYLEILDGEVFTISFSIVDTAGNSTSYSETLNITGEDSIDPATSLGNLMSAIDAAVTSSGTGMSIVLGADGALQVENQDGTGQGIKNLQVTSDGLRSKSYVSDVFAFPTLIADGDTGYSKALRSPATSDDTITSLYTETGTEMGFEGADEIEVNGSVGGDNISSAVSLSVGIPTLGGNKLNGAGLTVTANTKTVTAVGANFITNSVTAGDIIEIANVGSFVVEDVVSEDELTLATAPTVSSTESFQIGGATMQDLMDTVRDAFSLSEQDDSADGNDSVSINAAGSDDKIPDGSIVIRGKSGEAFALENVTIRGIDADNDSNPSPTNFTQNMAMTDYQDARDFGEYDTSIEVYDESGAAHTVVVTFTNTGVNGEWEWQASLTGQEEVVSGSRGTVYFNSDGTPASWTFQDQTSSFIFDPGNGSERVDLTFDFGKTGETGGLTQFSSDTTVTASGQDGYSTGALEDITINESGEINGAFTNGTSRVLAQIYLARFTNPAGMTKASDNMFAESNNSGDALMGIAGSSDTSSIRSGALEQGNVDLAEEFTNMIVTQRGYQATSRVVSTSNEILQELVNLSR